MTWPRITFIQAGGTLIAQGSNSLDFTSYGDTQIRLSAEDLLQECPELKGVAVVNSTDFREGGSRTLVPEDWLSLLSQVQMFLAADTCDGVVIGHGTNSLEETAFFLHLTLTDPRPIVLVGAMRPSNTLGSDARLNLLNAFRVAADSEARGRGVLVAMNGTILSARDVVKTATYGLDSFRGRDWGPVGFTEADGRNSWSSRAVPGDRVAPAFHPDPRRGLPRVDVILSYVGADGALIDAAVSVGARGLVSAGTGAGVVTPAEEAALLRASATGIVVCQSTRVSAGRVVRTASMMRTGFVAAGNLPAWKARLLLSLAVDRTRNVDEIQDLFDRT